jgi:biotin synthase
MKNPFSKETILAIPLHTREVYALMETANRLSREQFGEKGENHFHIGVNVAPCPINCLFCSLTLNAGIFQESTDFSEEQILSWAKHAQEQGADALNLMTTGNFSFQRLLEIGQMLKKVVNVPLVANTRDITHDEGEALLNAGFKGAYHAVRLGEGSDTPLKREKRIQTIQVIKEVGLLWRHYASYQFSWFSHDSIRYDIRIGNGQDGCRIQVGDGYGSPGSLHP